MSAEPAGASGSDKGGLVAPVDASVDRVLSDGQPAEQQVQEPCNIPPPAVLPAETTPGPSPVATSGNSPFPPPAPGAELAHSDLPAGWQAAVQSLPTCQSNFLEHLEGLTSGSDFDSWQLASAGDREHLLSLGRRSSGVPSDAACTDYEPSVLSDPWRECFENSDAEADYYRRLAGDSAPPVSEPASEQPSLAGVDEQRAKPGAVAESFALDWTRVQDSSLGFRFPWEKGFMKRVFADDRPSLPVLQASVPPLPSCVLPGATVQPKAPAWDLKVGLSVSSQCILCKADIPYEHRRKATLQKSVRKLQIFISCSSGCQGLPSFLQGGTEEQLCESLEACMGLKSCFTVEKRANSLLAYMRWFQVHLRPSAQGS